MNAESDTERAIFIITDIARLIQSEMERRMSRMEENRLTPGEARTLFFIGLLEGTSQSRLAAHMHVDPMTVSGYVDKLAEYGFVERTSDPNDRRVRRVVITRAAKEVLRPLMREIRSVEAEACKGLSQKEQSVLLGLLAKLRNNMRAIADTGDQCSACNRT